MKNDKESRLDELLDMLFSLFEEKKLTHKEVITLLSIIDDEECVAKYGEEGAVMALISIFRMFEEKDICIRASFSFFGFEE